MPPKIALSAPIQLTRPELYIVNFGDIHFNHPNNSTRAIIKNLYAALPDDAEAAKINIIVFTGDIFHNLMKLNNEYILDIKMWMAHVCALAKKHNILVRVLKGTPSHDWEQPRLFENVNAVTGIGADLKYVNTVSIEYIERYGISVLYVPDEANPTTEKTLSQVHDLLRAKGLDQVDFAFMHGQFDFQLPPHVQVQKHDSQAYLALVKELIFVGHVHTHSRFERIIAPGSTDRLTHGEEGPKGHIRVLAKVNGEYDIRFIENVTAKKFVTVTCYGMSLEETYEHVAASVKTLPDGSHVRIGLDRDNPLWVNMEELVRRYPLLTVERYERREKKREEDAPAERPALFKPITLTKENLVDVLMARIMERNPSAAVLKAARAMAEEAR
jgi:DNA repair exonuclease SbcCD nuclease subunit